MNNKMKSINNKYEMGKRENIILAKRLIKDIVWKEANLEGIPITFPETEMIFEGLSVAGYKVNDILVINNLKNAWKFLFDNLEEKLNFELVCKYNKIIGNSIDEFNQREGKIRISNVIIGGTDWVPEKPNMENIYSILESSSYLDNNTQKALQVYCSIAKGQWFENGNKRTAALAANHILIQKGNGIINIPTINQEQRNQFGKLLFDYYETGNDEMLKNWMYEYCIKGIS
jgi:Fic family protein